MAGWRDGFWGREWHSAASLGSPQRAYPVWEDQGSSRSVDRGAMQARLGRSGGCCARTSS